MAKEKVTLEDLRIDPDELKDFADQLRDIPELPDAGWSAPSIRIGDNITISGGWKGGPIVRVVITF